MRNIIFIFNAYVIITHLTYLTQLKQALQIEENTRIKNKNEIPLYI